MIEIVENYYELKQKEMKLWFSEGSGLIYF